MILTLFKSVGKAYVHSVVDDKWSSIADLLTTHIDSDSKKTTPMFNFAEFKTLNDPTTSLGRRYHGHYELDDKGEKIWVRDSSGGYDEIPNTVRRCKDNVVAINGIVLDVDANMTIEQALEEYAGYEFVLYTTFNHTPEKHKFRIVFPFSEPLLAEDIPYYQDSIVETFPGVDNASFTVSQSFYFHSGKNDYQAYWIDGEMLNPYNFQYRQPKQFVPNQVYTNNTAPDPEYKQAVLDSLRSCQGLHYPGTATNLGVLTLVSICRSIGLTFEEYDNLCQRIAAADSTLQQASVRRMAWTGWAGDRIRREKRDAFIQAYNGKPVKKIIKKFDLEEHNKKYLLYKEEQLKIKEGR